ncbi:MAG: hypothetical protein ACR2QL_00985 [Woeseiaceae bacterium]
MKTFLVRFSRVTVRTAVVLTMVITLSAFRSTDVEGYTDPDFIGYKFDTIVLQLPNASIDFKQHIVKRLSKDLKKNGVRVLLHEDLFTPTREWDQQSSAEVYARHSVDAGIVVTIGSAGSDSTPGMVMYNQTTVGGTTTGYVTQTSVARDHVDFEIAIVDATSMRTVWLGNLSTRGAGLLFVGPKDTAKSLSKNLIKEWKRAGHLHD